MEPSHRMEIAANVDIKSGKYELDTDVLPGILLLLLLTSCVSDSGLNNQTIEIFMAIYLLTGLSNYYVS